MRTKVYRKQVIEGYAVPAFIRNANNYFVNLYVYENGRVADWNFEDFEHFKKDVEKGWVRTMVPDGENISIFELGSFTITNGNWLYSNESFIEHIASLIAELNPHLDNQYVYRPKKIKGITYGESGNGTVYKDAPRYPNDSMPNKTDGESTNLFYKSGDKYYMVSLSVFADETFRVDRLQESIIVSQQQLEQWIADGILLTAIPDGSLVEIYGLGSFIITQTDYTEEIQNKLLALKDAIRKLKGEPTTVRICIDALEAYNQNPSGENKEKLKQAYEAIPEHHRVYVGDMDTRDSEVISIIYE